MGDSSSVLLFTVEEYIPSIDFSYCVSVMPAFAAERLISLPAPCGAE